MSGVLIPTDFSENSLKQLDSFIQNYEWEGFECVLMFSDFLDDSITDLLFYSQIKFLKEWKRRKPAHNSTLAKGGFSCSKDSFVINKTLVF